MPSVPRRCLAADSTICVRALLTVLAFTGAIALVGCPPAQSPTTEVVVPLTLAGQATATASAGARITAPDGTTLVIPTSAVAADTEIKLYQMAAADLRRIDGNFLAGAVLEPDGLTLSVPATLIVPLAEPADPLWPPLELEFRGDNPNDAVPTGAPVSLSPDGRTAAFQINHFCGRIAAENCYSGVYEYLCSVWQREYGATPEQIRARVKAKFPGVTLPTDLTRGSLMGRELQAFNETFCEHAYGFEPNQAIPATVLQELVDRVGNENRNVIVMFGPALTERSGPEQFFGGFGHSGAIEYYNARWQLRHSFPFWTEGLRRFMGGTNLAYWPIQKLKPQSAVFLECQDLTSFKESIYGVAFEAYICGSPGCGVPPANAEANSIEYQTRPFLPVNERNPMRVWAAARIWVERPQNHPIHRLSGCWAFDVRDSEGELEHHLLKFDQDGQLDSWWGYGTIGESGAASWGELLRFRRPNAGDFNLVFGNARASLAVLDPPTGFTLNYGFDSFEVSEGVRERKVATLAYTITGTFSQNEPGEWWSGTCQVDVTVFIPHQDGSETTENAHNSFAVRADRVACPDPAAADVYSQEELWNVVEQWVSQSGN